VCSSDLKPAEKTVRPVKKTAEKTKTVRTAKTARSAKTAQTARSAKTSQSVSAFAKTADPDKSTEKAKRGALAPSTIRVTQQDLKTTAKTQVDTAKTQVDTAKTQADTAKTQADTAKTQVDTAKTQTDTAKTQVDTAKTQVETAKTQADRGVQNNQPTRVQTAEQLMAAELAQSSKPLLNRLEEIIENPCTPTQVLEQPGSPGMPLGGNVMTTQFLTAEDVFQNELSRARVSVKAEITRTRTEAYKIVKRWSRWSIAASMIPTDFVDVAAISGVQVKMIYDLCKLYEVDFDRKAALAIASGVAGGAAVRTLAGVLAKQMIRWTPGIGTVFILAIEPTLSYVTTNAMGLVFISHFEEDGRLHDFNPEKIRQYMAAQLEKRGLSFKADTKPGHA
jgi:uncharacterized protein (DUF697 family)